MAVAFLGSLEALAESIRTHGPTRRAFIQDPSMALLLGIEVLRERHTKGTQDFAGKETAIVDRAIATDKKEERKT